eukprot:4928947-Prymnesium_polylepis.1
MLPRLHHVPTCADSELENSTWHDVTGALTIKGTHHVFMGCPRSHGWSHATSTDFVHWTHVGDGPTRVHEKNFGMDSMQSPCSGFVALNDRGTPCAGFRQCGSVEGATELNPDAQSWDVPLEVRCATNESMIEWGEPQWLAPIYFYRALPYDPVRPWRDYDGKWYFGLSTDGCNTTTRQLPCTAGGQLD